MVPSTIVGRIRWLSADLKAPACPDSSELISMKPVTDGKKYIREMRPDTGVHCRMPENRMMSSRPHQKIGIENPTSAVPIDHLIEEGAALDAAKTPAGMPSTTAKIMAHSDNSSVAGNSWRNWPRTDSLLEIDVPKSPLQHSPQIVEILDDDVAILTQLMLHLLIALGRHHAFA